MTLAVPVAACGGGQETAAEPSASQAPVFKPVDPAQAANLFAQPGASRFEGVLPCADCAGIRTELMLLQDPGSGEPQVYELKETYLGSMSTDGEKTATNRGKWRIIEGTPADEKMTVYRLESADGKAAVKDFERVSEQELRLLDREGRRIESDLNYSLTRVPAAPVLTFPSAAQGTAPPAAPGAASVGQMPAAMVTDKASGWPITMRVGQEMTARLTADGGAGTRWALRAGSDGGVVALAGEPAREADPGGGAGVDVFRLKAVKPGSTTLTFDLKGSAATPIRSASYPVTVQ